MGVTAFLECYGSEEFDPASGGTGLFSTKGLLPPAWFLFFDATDFASVRSNHDGSTYSLLRRPASPAVARAHERLEALKPHITPELDAALHSFLAAVEKACAPHNPGVLVFNTHRFETEMRNFFAKQMMTTESSRPQSMKIDTREAKISLIPQG